MKEQEKLKGRITFPRKKPGNNPEETIKATKKGAIHWQGHSRTPVGSGCLGVA
jgi:hypothetical protein